MTDSLQNISSSQPSKRLAIVDILRGYALLGVAIINYTSFHNWDYQHGNTIDTVLGFCATYVFFRKSALLLSVLFGYGFAVLIDNLKRKGDNTILFFSKRMFWLFVIAFINSIFFDGDILKSYAVLGMLLLLFHKSSTKTIFVTAIVLLLLIPFSSGYTLFGMQSNNADASGTNNLFLSHRIFDVIRYNFNGSYKWQLTFPFYAISVQHIMLCCFLFGMLAHRMRFIENISKNKKYIKRMFWFSIPAFALSTWLTQLGSRISFLRIYYNFFIISFLCAMVFFTSAIIWLYMSGRLRRFFKAMENYGRMTLTNYLVQNIIGFFVFSGIGLSIGNSKPYWFYFTLAIAVFIVQLFISRYWLTKYNYGPVEWMWRRLSSNKMLSFKKRN